LTTKWTTWYDLRTKPKKARSDSFTPFRFYNRLSTEIFSQNWNHFPIPQATMNGERDNRRHQNNRYQFGINHQHTIIEVSPLFGRVFQYGLWLIQTCWDFCVDFVTIPIFSDEVLLRISLLLVCSEKVSTISEQLMAMSLTNLNETSLNHVDNINSLIPSWWVLACPVMTVLLICIAVSSPYWCHLFPSIREETFMLIIPLVTLFLLEAFLPVLIFISSTLLLLRQVDWFTGMALLLTVWALLSIITHFVRCSVYQHMNEPH